jgi:hypothetical protein
MWLPVSITNWENSDLFFNFGIPSYFIMKTNYTDYAVR